MLRAQLQVIILLGKGQAGSSWYEGRPKSNICVSCTASRSQLIDESRCPSAARLRQANHHHLFTRAFALTGRNGFQIVGQPDQNILYRRLTRTTSVVMASSEISKSSRNQNLSSSIELNDNPTAPGGQFYSSVVLPAMLPRQIRLTQLSMVEQAFLLLGFIACMTSFALFALIVTAIPTLNAMRKAAVSMEKLADVAREELPGTMAAIRLSGMEISDLTLELNDLSQEISDGMKSSARAVQAAEVGLRRMGSVAASQTLAMLQERASVPVEVVKPAVVSAAATTLQAVAQAQQMVFNFATHPRITGWLGRKGQQEEKQKSLNLETMQESSPAVIQTLERAQIEASESSRQQDEVEMTHFASSDAFLRPDESDYLLFDGFEEDEDEEEAGTLKQG